MLRLCKSLRIDFCVLCRKLARYDAFDCDVRNRDGCEAHATTILLVRESKPAAALRIGVQAFV